MRNKIGEAYQIFKKEHPLPYRYAEMSFQEEKGAAAHCS